VLFEIKCSEGIFYIEAPFENRVYMKPYQANSVIRIEVFRAQESCPNLKEDLTKSTREHTCLHPILHTLIDLWSTLRIRIFMILDHFHYQICQLFRDSAFPQFVFWVEFTPSVQLQP